MTTNAVERQPLLAALPWLAVGAVLQYFALLDRPLMLAAWFAPALLLRFVRRQPAWRGLALSYLALALVLGFSMRGMVPVPDPIYFGLIAVLAIGGFVPFAIDRLVTPRLPALAATLVLPTAMTTLGWLNAFGPYGSWGTLTFTQISNLPLMQSIGVCGLWGVVFLIGWFAAIVNYALEQGCTGKPALRALAAFAMVLIAVQVAGEARLAFAPVEAPTVRIAALSPAKFAVHADEALQGELTAAQTAPFREATAAAADDLFARSALEAAAGAKIVFWSETALLPLKTDEAALIARGSAFAKAHKIYLGMAMGVITPGAARPLENTLVLIAPDGTVAWQYLKARPVPGREAQWSSPSDGRLKAADTPYGRITGAICFDGDFPDLIAQAGALKADILLLPSNDWRDIDPIHTEMASARAIEQGINLVRQASKGYSAAYDYQGRKLAAMDHYQTAEHVLVAHVPTKGVPTLYAALGDWLAYLNVAGLLALIGWGIVRRKKG